MISSMCPSNLEKENINPNYSFLITSFTSNVSVIHNLPDKHLKDNLLKVKH